ncbi:hypothetical protein AVEN_19386-1 [Araneus ventricosus]|uniref:Uncharacterized protein n=1 Tax=Araneus ventricosus TaxID=182803 RepID=A0A4Y2KFM1_ARAVE|nr:hypothetical protein AVEN_19386-1 [Araneus ventricosus]
MLIKKFADENITVEQVVENAEATIVSKAVEGAGQSDCVIVVGEDIDFPVILTVLAPDNNLLFLMKPGKKDTIFYSPTHFKLSTKVRGNILFLQCFQWMRLDVAIFRQGKIKFFKLLDKDSGIKKAAEVFKNHNAAAGEVGE